MWNDDLPQHVLEEFVEAAQPAYEKIFSRLNGQWAWRLDKDRQRGRARVASPTFKARRKALEKARYARDKALRKKVAA